VRHSIPVCCNEHASWILTDTECGVLNLVVVDIAVKAHYHCSYLQQDKKAINLLLEESFADE
jgi:hypothetical protein